MSATDQTTTVSRRRIANNATFLVARTIISTLIGLFTSRVVLEVLGADDYGVYCVAGLGLSVVGFATASLAGASSRFITYAIGRGDDEERNRTFATALYLHIAMAVLVVIVGETIGLWILETQLNIDPARMTAARWIFHLTLVSTALGVTQTPYTAIIMSYERMSAFAGFDILGMVLRLVIVYLLLTLEGDKLILYSVMGCGVGWMMLILNRAYCLKRFRECRIFPRLDKAVARKMFSYSGFTLLSTFCVSMCFSGTTFLINIFFGVAINAAAALAATVHGITMLFGANIQAAFRPQIVKQYAARNADNVWNLACMSGKFTVLIMAGLVVPCMIEAPTVLAFWLGEVPPMAVEFLRCMLAAGWITCMSNQLDTVAYSSSRIGLPTACKCICFLLNLGVIYLLFRAGAPSWSAYISNGFMYITLIGCTLSIIRRRMPGFSTASFVTGALKGFAVALVAAIPAVAVTLCMEPSMLRVVIVIAANIIPLAALSFALVLSAPERAGVLSLLGSWFRRFHLVPSRTT